MTRIITARNCIINFRAIFSLVVGGERKLHLREEYFLQWNIADKSWTARGSFVALFCGYLKPKPCHWETGNSRIFSSWLKITSYASNPSLSNSRWHVAYALEVIHVRQAPWKKLKLFYLLSSWVWKLILLFLTLKSQRVTSLWLLLI